MADPMKPSPPLRLKIFVDFWNFQLAMGEVEAAWRADYRKMPWVILDAVREELKPPQGVGLAGMKVYGSYDPASKPEMGMRRWASNTLARFPGVSVEFVERQKKKTGPKCPSCRKEVPVCPHCGASMRGTGEKGVDTRIATDMIRFAWEGAYDVGVLISADRDFEPVCQFLGAKGLTILHGSIGFNGAVVSKACWGRVDLLAIKERFRLPPRPPAAVA